MEQPLLEKQAAPPVLTKQEIQAIIAFMERAQLTGKEAYVFYPIVSKLHELLKENKA